MIRILTDSASDILPAEAATLGVDVIPLNVTLEDGTVIRDGVDLTPSEYYEHMAGCKKLPTTSQPSPELFEKFYAEAAAAGDEVVGIFLSHELSGTYQCAKLAADLANVDNVLFVDSTNVCLGEGLLVRLAAHLRDEGKSAVQIAATLEHAKEHLHLVAAIINSRIKRVVYGAADVKAGCCGSVTDLFAQPFNHHPVIEKGLRADEAQQLLQEFFVSLRARRAAKPRWKPPVNP